MQIRAAFREPLDALLVRETGTASLDAVFAANPGLAGHGVTIPAGTVIAVDASTGRAPVRAMVQLWD